MFLIIPGLYPELQTKVQMRPNLWYQIVAEAMKCMVDKHFSLSTAQSGCGLFVFQRTVGFRMIPRSLLLSITMMSARGFWALLYVIDGQWTSSNTSNSFFWRKKLAINVRTWCWEELRNSSLFRQALWMCDNFLNFILSADLKSTVAAIIHVAPIRSAISHFYRYKYHRYSISALYNELCWIIILFVILGILTLCFNLFFIYRYNIQTLVNMNNRRHPLWSLSGCCRFLRLVIFCVVQTTPKCSYWRRPPLYEAKYLWR